MESHLRSRGEQVSLLRSRAMAAFAMTTLLFLSRENRETSSIAPDAINFFSFIHPNHSSIVITEGIIPQSQPLPQDVKLVYDYNNFGMAAYEVKNEKAREQLEQSPYLKNISDSENHMASNDATLSSTNQTEETTKEGWQKIMDQIGITAVASLYHINDLSDHEICMVDTAFDVDHPAIAPHIAAQACFSSTTEDIKGLCLNGKDIDTESKNAASDENCGGECEHGTMTTSTAVMKTNLKASLAKVASAFGGDAPGLKDADIIAGLNWCLERKKQGKPVVVVNLSASHYSGSAETCNDMYGATPYVKALEKMSENDINTTLSAGNFYSVQQVSMPSCITTSSNQFIDGNMAISASTFPDQNTNSKEDEAIRIAGFSNRSATLTTTFAPGTNIPVAVTGGKYGKANGTSFSAPFTALASVYLKNARPQLRAGRREQLIHDGSIHMDDHGEAFMVLDAWNSIQIADQQNPYHQIFRAILPTLLTK